jgi:hypothetical protein
MIGPRATAKIGAALTAAIGCGADELGPSSGAKVNLLGVQAGQSNDGGLCISTNVDNYPGFTTPYGPVSIRRQGATLADPPSWVTEGPVSLQPRTIGVNGTTYAAGTCGFEVSMGRTIDQAGGVNLYIAQLFIDGSGLENHWLNPSYPTVGTKLQQQFKDYITARLADVPGMTLGYIMWNQGEADAGEAPDATDYYNNLVTFVGDLRTTFPGNWWFLMNRLSKRATGGQLINVRAAEEDFAANPANKAAWVGLDDLALRDTAHFIDDGYPTGGTRLGLKIVDLRAGTTSLAPTYITGGVPVVAASGAGIANIPFITNYATNDRALLFVSGIGNTPYAAPAGWSEVANSPQHDGASGLNARIHCFTKVLTAGAESAPTVADVAGDDAKLGTIVIIRGTGAAAPTIDITAGATAAASTSLSLPSVTTTADNCLIVQATAIHNDIGTWQFDAYANAGLSSLVEQYDFNTTTGTGAGLGIVTGIKVAHGAIGNTTGTIAASTTQAMLTIALRL